MMALAMIVMGAAAEILPVFDVYVLLRSPPTH